MWYLKKKKQRKTQTHRYREQIGDRDIGRMVEGGQRYKDTNLKIQTQS